MVLQQRDQGKWRYIQPDSGIANVVGIWVKSGIGHVGQVYGDNWRFWDFGGKVARVGLCVSIWLELGVGSVEQDCS